jgi:addiction module RelB/DinJ family antitoxin
LRRGRLKEDKEKRSTQHAIRNTQHVSSASAVKKADPAEIDMAVRVEPIRYTTEQGRNRVDKRLLKAAEKVCQDIGIAPSQAVSLFFGQLVKSGGLPFRPSRSPALDEYGVTLAQARTAEMEARRELDADEKAGRLIEFKGSLG